MTSFTRPQYEHIFRFARNTYVRASSSSEAADAALIMWMVEDIIGQQSNFPAAARLDYPRAAFRHILAIVEER